MDRHFPAEWMEDLECRNCGKIGLWRQNVLEATPDLLCIHLNRATFDRATMTSVKDGRVVKIPERVDLGKYFQPESIGTSKYHLYAVVKHRGTIRWGHYVAWAKCPKKWYKYDDTVCRDATLGQARSQEKPVKKGASKPTPEDRIFTPFLLFYAREPYAKDGIENPVRRANAISRARPRPAQPVLSQQPVLRLRGHP